MQAAVITGLFCCCCCCCFVLFVFVFLCFFLLFFFFFWKSFLFGFFFVVFFVLFFFWGGGGGGKFVLACRKHHRLTSPLSQYLSMSVSPLCLPVYRPILTDLRPTHQLTQILDIEGCKVVIWYIVSKF